MIPETQSSIAGLEGTTQNQLPGWSSKTHPKQFQLQLLSPRRKNTSNVSTLTDRERIILRLVVQNFIKSAGPIGSKYLSEQFGLGISSASIRNTMSDLEAKGFLGHPHTSAGRVPTNLGYRTFVDSLMQSVIVSETERRLIQKRLADVLDDSETLFREGSRLLARLAKLLGVVLSPHLTSGVLERLEVVQVSSNRVMFVLSVDGGLIRTIVMHVDAELRRDRLDRLVELLNERLAGLTLDELRKSCASRVDDLKGEETGLVQLILNESAQLFSDSPADRTIEVGGTTHILAQPEFTDPESIRNLVALIDDESSVVRLLEESEEEPAKRPGIATVHIGKGVLPPGQTPAKQRTLSVVTAPYYRSNLQGTIGVIGPTRMDYARVIALVEGIAMMMSWPSQESLRA